MIRQLIGKARLGNLDLKLFITKLGNSNGMFVN